MLREEREGEGEGSGLVNSANADGITALHQACIDESMEMVDFLLAHGANVNQADNEGWTALHVAASCGHLEIADFLLQNGASLAAVNCDGDVPVDIAEDEATETLLTETTRRQGLDVESVKRREEEEMMRDAQCWLKDGMPTDLRHPKNGATPLHVAAAKGYLEVMRALCDCGVDLSVGDSDGWTPLHAAAHWGQMDACRLLAERHCDMEAQSHSGQTPFDVADESVESLLEELAQKQAQWRTQHQSVSERQQSVSESSAESPASTTSKNRRSSVCRMSSREKMSVQDQSKERGAPGGLELREEERESSPESSVVSSPDSESVSTLSPTDPLTVAKAQEQREREEREREERERERESRTARVQPTPQRRDTPPESPADRQTDRRKYQAPVRDEESESQRRARSRLMRQSRRSTQVHNCTQHTLTLYHTTLLTL
ncbi:PP12C phosphatase, partial [Amia calva]|nr:PP12C phosphatase [Amia calva]